MENSPPAGTSQQCPSCKKPVEPGHKFCPGCGAKIDLLPTCRNCGAVFLAPVKFCEMCGAPVVPPGQPLPTDIPVHEPEQDHVPEAEPGEGDRSEFSHEPEPEPDIEEELPEEPEPVYEAPVKVPVQKSPAAAISPEDGTGVSGSDPLAPAFSGLSDMPGKPAAEKPANKKPMDRRLVIGAVIVVILVIAGAYFIGLPMLKGKLPGGSNAKATPVPTPEPEPTAVMTMPPAPVETTATPLPTADPMVPEPTQMMPENQKVYFSVQKDQVNGRITFQFQRGPGENLIRSADVKVTYPDGTVKTGIIKPSQGISELVLAGSKNTDRAEIIVNMHSGQTYRVYDELLSFRKY
jgi:RNA polymerase subunit RPABC4/transcription elongation factor Spt4